MSTPRSRRRNQRRNNHDDTRSILEQAVEDIFDDAVDLNINGNQHVANLGNPAVVESALPRMLLNVEQVNVPGNEDNVIYDYISGEDHQDPIDNGNV